MKLLFIALITLFALTLTFTSAQAQSPSLNIERLNDYSLKLTWSNISTDNDRWNIFVDESGRISLLVSSGTVRDRYTFFADSSNAITREHFTKVNNANRIGVGGNDGTDDRVDIRWVDVPNPTLIVQRLVDNSIQVTWNNIYTKDAQYSIPIIESGARNVVGLTTSEETYNIPTNHAQFDRVSGAEKICVIGTDGGVILPGDALCKSVPAGLGVPTVTAERLTGNFIKLSWEGIRTNELVKSFQVFITKNSLETRLNGAIYFDTNVALFLPGTEFFNQINDADRVGIAGRLLIDGESEDVDKTFVAVPAQRLPGVTFEREANGDILISWENIGNGDRNAIWITADGGDTRIIPLVPNASFYHAATGSTYYDRISGAERVGVSNFGASVRGVTFTPVIPGIPALSEGTITDTTIALSWTEAPGATEYELFRDGNSVRTTDKLTFTDTGLAPDTAYTYTITSESAYGHSSLPSASLTVSTVSELVAVTSLSFDYKTNGNTLVSFTPLKAGTYAVSYEKASGETDVPTVHTIDSHVNLIEEITLLTLPGYAGAVIISFGDAEQIRGTIAVPPAPPTVTVERQADGSIVLAWENIRTSGNYNIRITESGEDKILRSVPSDTSEYTFSPDDFGNNFNRVGNAERIGVDGVVDGRVTDQVWISIPPLISVTDLSFKYNDSGNTIVSFTPSVVGVHTISYDIAADNTESFVPSTTVNVSVIDEPATTTLSTSYGYVGTVGVSFDGTEYASGTISVPPDSPTLSLGTVTATSIEITWEAPRSATEYVIYYGADLLERTNDLSYTHTGLIPGTEHTYTVAATYDIRTSALSTSLTATTSSLPAGTLSFSYNDDGNTLVSLTPTVAGDYTISYAIAASNDETSVDSVTVTALANTLATAPPLLTSHGYAGVVTASLGSAEYATGTIKVPPAAPVLREGTVAATSIQLVWDAPRGATSYVITADGTAQSPVTITTFTHTGLSPETEHTYTVTSTDGTTTSAPSNEISATTDPLPEGSLSFDYNDSGHTEVSFTPSVAGQHTIRYTIATGESSVGSKTVTVTVPQIGTTLTTTLLTLPGYAGEVTASFADTVYATGTVAVPPAAPVLREGTVTDTSIEITWDALRSATEYLIYEDDILVDTVSTTTFTHTSLTAGTDYTYTAESRYGTTTSVRSEELAVSTLETPVTSDKITGVTHEVLPNGSTNIEFIPNVAATFVITYSDQTVTVEIRGVDLETIVNINTVFGFKGDVVISIDDEEVGRLSIQVPPAPPTLSVGVITDTTVTLSWTAPLGAVSYELFRNDDPTPIEITRALTFTDTGLTAGTEYTYHVISIDDIDQKSGASNDLIATPTEGPTVTAKRIDNNYIELTWKNIDTSPLGAYQIFVITGTTETRIEGAIVSGASVVIDSDHLAINPINDADRVGIAGSRADGVGGTEYLDKTFVDVPRVLELIVTARIQSDDSKVTLDNILPGNYILHTKDTTHQSDPITVIAGTNTYNLTFTSEGLAQLIDDEEICISDTDDANNIGDELDCEDLRKSGGSSNEWKTKPTFGNSWDTQTQLVEAGFVFNGIPLTITDNWHTDFDLTSSIIGENNTVHIKSHASNDFKSVTLSLGIPEIGKKYDAESHIILNLNRNYTAPSNYQITEIIHDQKEKLVNESITSATLSKVKCTPADVMEQCIDFEISFTMMAPLTGEVLAISAMDSQYREAVTFINSGVEFVGESLLESQTHVLTQKYSNQHQAETIELTQLDRRYQMWEDQNGYLWTQNEYGSWLQITIPDVTQRDDPATSVMTRNHSNFAGMITQEQDRATLIFDSSEIQGMPDEPFAHDEPIRLEKLSNPEVLEILHMQALLAEELLCDCILHED